MEGSRAIGVAVDFSSCGKKALEFAVEHMVRAGDHLILVNVQPEGYYEEGEMQLWEATGSPLISLSDFSDPTVAKKYGVKPDPESMDLLSTAARQKEIFVVLKIFYGDPREKICEAIDKVPLTCLVIGSRGLSKIKRILLGSVSDYVMNNGTCPVMIVKNQES